jgi:hypothetical protein
LRSKSQKGLVQRLNKIFGFVEPALAEAALALRNFCVAKARLASSAPTQSRLRLHVSSTKVLVLRLVRLRRTRAERGALALLLAKGAARPARLARASLGYRPAAGAALVG